MPSVPLHQTGQIYPPSIEHRCLKTITPNLADLPALKHRSLDVILRNMQLHIDGESHICRSGIEKYRDTEIVPFQVSLSTTA